MKTERQFKFINPVTGSAESIGIPVISGFDINEQIEALIISGRLNDRAVWLLSNGWIIN